MLEQNDYTRVLGDLYGKSLILEEISDFHPVLHFYFVDSIAHLDFTLSTLGYNIMSPKNIMNMEYMRWRVDEEKKGDRQYFMDFINWLKVEDPDRYDALPLLWTTVYDREDPGSYRSFRIVMHPDDKKPLPPQLLSSMIDDFFEKPFLKQLYRDSTLARLFDGFVRSKTAE
jgi:hypothetical protein